MGGKEHYRVERIVAFGDYVQWGPFRAFEEGFHVYLAVFEEELGPQCATS